jgi:hypothetical protein
VKIRREGPFAAAADEAIVEPVAEDEREPERAGSVS